MKMRAGVLIQGALILAAGAAVGVVDGLATSEIQVDSMLPGDRAELVGATLALGIALSCAGGLLGTGLGALVRRWWRASVPFPVVGSAVALLIYLATTPPSEATPPRTGDLAASDAQGDIVLITLDTFRADHLSAIGGASHPVRTPSLDDIAGAGALFVQGVTPTPLTLPAHTAMMTGRMPPAVGVFRNGNRLDPDVPTVAEDLRGAGWRTSAFVSAGVLRRATGIDAGFTHYDDRFSLADRVHETRLGGLVGRVFDHSWRARERRGDHTVDRALRWWSIATSPRFMWVHLYDPHAPYDPPPPYDTMYASGAPDAPGNPEEMARLKKRRGRDMGWIGMPADARGPIARYAGEVTWTDAQVGRLVAGLGESTQLVIAADHGESLTEHAYVLSHGSHLYQASIRVPVLIRSPRVPAGTRVDTPVSLMDVGGAIADLAGRSPRSGRLIALANGQGEGESELLAYSPRQQSRRVFDAKARWRIAYRQGEVKWIGDSWGRTERYVLTTDPVEVQDTAPDHPDRAALSARAKADLTELKERAAGTNERLDPEMLETLEALGYVH